MTKLQVTKTHQIEDHDYIVGHFYDEPHEQGSYKIMKVGKPGETVSVYRTSFEMCNCKSLEYGRMRSPGFQCKHMRLAIEQDSIRRTEYVKDMALGTTVVAS